ncbi:hypothetical protein [Acidisoma cladoniae]|uniref:hypothetical protein n=1 Tax=Acidisoma cladoniae TaxID=3040935 RepID=UPI00254A8BC3|nr:hypothetical protein [Acidisoma sp. PAMC 29798]
MTKTRSKQSKTAKIKTQLTPPFAFDLSDPLIRDVLSDHMRIIANAHVELAQQPGGGGEDTAWRSLVRDLIETIAEEADDDATFGVGCVRQALDEIAATPDDIATVSDFVWPADYVPVTVSRSQSEILRGRRPSQN